MNEEFRNAGGDYCAFTDDGIVCKNIAKNRFYPYGSIDKIGFSLGSLDIQGKANGENLAFIYVASGKDQKARLKELVVFAKSKMKTATRTEVVEIVPKEQIEAERKAQQEQERAAKAAKRAEEYAELYKEIRMRCNVCGHVFCYTKKDLKDNQANAALTALSGVGTIAAVIGGNRYDMYEQGKLANRNASKIVDYSRCPSCRSTNLVRLSDDEVVMQPQNATASAPVPTSSPVEEIKKYKELLDMGIITQEEFDAKKKQLLGL